MALSAAHKSHKLSSLIVQAMQKPSKGTTADDWWVARNQTLISEQLYYVAFRVHIETPLKFSVESHN